MKAYKRRRTEKLLRVWYRRIWTLRCLQIISEDILEMPLRTDLKVPACRLTPTLRWAMGIKDDQ